MAGRIRTIKPEMIEDAIVAGLSHEAFRLFIGMITMADDHGNLRAASKWLDGQVFHGRPSVTPIEELREELGRKLVLFYDVDGQTYAHINGWQKHQRIDNCGEPRIPLPPGWTVQRRDVKDGSRFRFRWVSTGPTALVGVGAAPTTTQQHTGSAFGPPDHDHDHDQDHDPQGASAPAVDGPIRESQIGKGGRRKAAPAPSTHPVTVRLRESGLLVPPDEPCEVVAGAILALARAGGRTAGEVVEATTYALDGLLRALSSANGVGEGKGGPFIVASVTGLLAPGGLEAARTRRQPRAGPGAITPVTETMAESEAFIESQRAAEKRAREAAEKRDRELYARDQANKAKRGDVASGPKMFTPRVGLADPRTAGDS